MTGPNEEPDGADRWDVPPWELPGSCRLDSEPHRGTLLRRLANTGFLVAIASCYPCIVTFPVCCLVEREALRLLWIPAVILGLYAAGCGVATVRLANGDLTAMREGRVDPRGQGETEFARRCAGWDIVIGLISVLIWGSLALLA